MKIKKITFALLTAVIFLTSCNAKSINSAAEPKKKELFAMDTYVTFQVYGQNSDKVLEQAENEIKRLEDIWSTTKPNSEIYAVNHSGGKSVVLSNETAELINFALEISKDTNGALDISLYPVLKEWGFTTDKYSVPDNERLTQLLKNTGFERINLNGNEICLPKEMQIDLGAVGKGYAGDLICEKISNEGVSSALVNLGGNVQTVGTKPDGSNWKISVTSPYGDGSFATVELADEAIVTSGGYERYFVGDDGKTYHHILDPDTGKPADSGLISVSIIGKEGRLCDALSTALFVSGLKKAEDLWRKRSDFDMILVTDKGKIYITEGIENRFSLAQSHKNLDVSVIRK